MNVSKQGKEERISALIERLKKVLAKFGKPEEIKVGQTITYALENTSVGERAYNNKEADYTIREADLAAFDAIHDIISLLEDPKEVEGLRLMPDIDELFGDVFTNAGFLDVLLNPKYLGLRGQTIAHACSMGKELKDAEREIRSIYTEYNPVLHQQAESAHNREVEEKGSRAISAVICVAGLAAVVWLVNGGIPGCMRNQEPAKAPAAAR